MGVTRRRLGDKVTRDGAQICRGAAPPRCRGGEREDEWVTSLDARALPWPVGRFWPSTRQSRRQCNLAETATLESEPFFLRAVHGVRAYHSRSGEKGHERRRDVIHPPVGFTVRFVGAR